MNGHFGRGTTLVLRELTGMIFQVGAIEAWKVISSVHIPAKTLTILNPQSHGGLESGVILFGVSC